MNKKYFYSFFSITSIKQRMLFILCFILFPFCAFSLSDYIYGNDFEDYANPTSEKDIARFLTQATFGSAPGAINSFGNNSYQSWIEQQQNLTPTTHRDVLEMLALERGESGSISHDDRVSVWNRTAIQSPDQLRQRIAFALSEIFVISQNEKTLAIRLIVMAEFYDILVRNAFGNYRELLEDVARSPAMGFYLSHLKNRKKELVNPVTNTYITPDENFAREVMQLFSIGLYERNLDFSLLDGNSNEPGIQKIDTYDQNIVTNLSRVMTGFGFQCNGPATITNGTVSVEIGSPDCKPGTGRICQGVHCNFGSNFFSFPYPAPNSGYNGIFNPDIYRPLICFPRLHDIGRDSDGNPNPSRPATGPYPDEPYQDKRIVGFLPGIGSGTLPMSTVECDDLAGIPEPNAAQLQRMQVCVDYCDSELDQALDALFYHPNTAPMIARQLIQRFVTSNPSSGYIKRVADVFVDNGNGVRGDLGAVIEAILLDYQARGPQYMNDPQFGKLKEPLLKLTGYYRAMETVTADPEQLNWGPAREATTADAFGQRVLAAPSVFNFFQPDYQQPGELSNANLYSPEFQILNDNTAILGQNTVHFNVCSGYGNPNASNPPHRNSNCATSNFDFFPPEDSAYIPAAVLDGLPSNFEAMVEELNLRLLYGNMSGTFNPSTGMKGILKNRIEVPMSGVDVRLRAITIVNLILASPEYAVQR